MFQDRQTNYSHDTSQICIAQAQEHTTITVENIQKNGLFHTTPEEKLLVSQQAEVTTGMSALFAHHCGSAAEQLLPCLGGSPWQQAAVQHQERLLVVQELMPACNNRS